MGLITTITILGLIFARRKKKSVVCTSIYENAAWVLKNELFSKKGRALTASIIT